MFNLGMAVTLVKLSLKTDFVSHPARAEGLGIYISLLKNAKYIYSFIFILNIFYVPCITPWILTTYYNGIHL